MAPCHAGLVAALQLVALWSTLIALRAIAISVDPAVYRPAWWVFDSTHARFDGTSLSWSTDLVMAATFVFNVLQCRESHPILRWSSWNYVLSALSSIGGCTGHVFFGSLVADGRDFDASLDVSLNRTGFRLNWIATIGLLAAAAAPTGVLASWFAAQTAPRPHHAAWRPPVVAPIVWWLYVAGCCMCICVGGISFQRPAADVLLAGSVQTIPVLYLVWASRPWWTTQLLLGATGSAVLIALYHVLFHAFPTVSLGAINCVCHLLVAVFMVIHGMAFRAVAASFTRAPSTRYNLRSNPA